MNGLEELNKIIAESKNIVFFGGAGMSTESGIPDFRSADGLYRRGGEPIPPETVLSRSFFNAHPEEFFDFYRKCMLYPDAKPNAAHKKLAELEAAGRLMAVVTQNIDGLHQAAGSKNVVELHGSVLRNTCMKCHKSFDMEFILRSSGVPRCDCGGIVKPDVVLYEESLSQTAMLKAAGYIGNADTVIVGGTSLAVYPAAGLLQYRGGRLVIINRSETPFDRYADFVLRDSLAETLGKISVPKS